MYEWLCVLQDVKCRNYLIPVAAFMILRQSKADSTSLPSYVIILASYVKIR